MKCVDCTYYKPLVQHTYDKKTKRLEPVTRRRGTCTLKRKTKYTTAVSSCKKFEPALSVPAPAPTTAPAPAPAPAVTSKVRRVYAIKFGKS